MSAKSTVTNEAKEGPAGKGDRPQAGVKHNAVKGALIRTIVAAVGLGEVSWLPSAPILLSVPWSRPAGR